MANLNRFTAIGRAASDGETRSVGQDKTVGKIRLAVSYKAAKKNPQTGQWEGGEALFIDLEGWNGQYSSLADIIGGIRKGQQVYIEGRLRENQWTDQQGNKRSKILIVADKVVLFSQPATENGNGGRPQQQPQQQRRSRTSQPEYPADDYVSPPDDGQPGGIEEDIPF